MVTEHLDDGEGELLARVRRVVGPRRADRRQPRPACQRDPAHGRCSRCADRLPDLSARRHGRDRRARRVLPAASASTGMARPACSVRRLPFLIPLSAQCTDARAVAQSIYAELARMEDADVPSLSFTPGFPAADFPECGPVVLAYGRSDGRCRRRERTPGAARGSARGRLRRRRCTTPRTACAARCGSPRARRARSSSPTRRTTREPAATPTPPACCARLACGADRAQRAPRSD